jgi:phosphopentomutase
MKRRFGLQRLYDLCELVRGHVDALNIGRVIARPFVGTSAETFRAHRQPARLFGAAARADAARQADRRAGA